VSNEALLIEGDNMDMMEHKLQTTEHEAWTVVCNQIKEIMGISSKQFNDYPEVKKLSILIERWASKHRDLRNYQVDCEIIDEDQAKKGVFYKGD
jgi:hypothetical protein